MGTNEQRLLRVTVPSKNPELTALADKTEANLQEMFQMLNNLDQRIAELEAAP